ncbi:MAG: hypothetical protein KKB31_05925, partial [Nanoarchaeota archaeon]|nr:hypothetical protein [Nanoarchaeota archaeon]
KGIKFNVLENHSKFVEITKLDRNKVKLQVHKSYQEKIKKLKDFCDGLLKEIKHPAPRLAILNIKERIDKIMRGKE